MKRYDVWSRARPQSGLVALAMAPALVGCWTLLVAGCGPSSTLDRESRLPPIGMSGPVLVDGGAGPSLERTDGPGVGVSASDGSADGLVVEPNPSVDAGVVDTRPPAAADAAAPAAADAASAIRDAAPLATVDLAPADLASDGPRAPDQAGAMAPGPVSSWSPGQGTGDLSALGLADWVHFGRGGAESINRKAGVVSPRIRMALAGGGALSHFSDSAVRLTWTNGSPAAAVSEVGDGVANGGATGRGFRLEVTGDPARPSRLKLFIGVWEAQAQLVARIGDDPPLPALVEDVETGSAERIYTVTFGPLPTLRPLVVTWTVNMLHHVYGNVTLRAATLEDF